MEEIKQAFSDSSLDYSAYQAKALSTEKTPEKIIGDKPAVLASLQIAAAAGDLIDLIKRSVIYGKEIEIEDLVASVRSIEVSMDAFESALFRDVPDDYDGEVIPVNPRLFHSIVGQYGENGELVKLLIDQIEGKEFDIKNYREEQGDASWYQSIGLDEVETTLAEVLSINNAKLELRAKKGTITNPELRDREEERALFGSDTTGKEA